MVLGLAAYGAGVAVVGATWLCLKIFGKKNPTKKRRMSFNSVAMIDGAFPPTCDLPPPIINCLLLFNECPLHEVVVENCKKFAVFERSRGTPVLVNGQWTIQETDVNMEDHVSLVNVESESDMMKKIDEIMATDMDGYGKKPLWSIVRLNNTGAGLSGILIRIHHIIGDGVALVEAMRNMFQDEDGNVLTVDLPSRSRGDAQASPLTVAWRFLKAIFQVVTLPNTPYDSFIAFTSKHKKTMSSPSNKHKTVLFPSLRLDFVKALKTKASCTVNDIYFCALAGAIRRYSIAKGDTDLGSHTQCRALMPVAFPRSAAELADRYRALRNKWSFVSAALPVGQDGTAKNRLKVCRETTSALKKSPAALVQLWFQNNIMCNLPKFLVQKIAFDAVSRHSVVISNVPGPSKTVVYGGAKLMGMQFFFPNLIPQYDVVSYKGGVFANINIDTDVVTEPDLLSKYFMEEINELATDFDMDLSPEKMLCPKSAGGVFEVVAH